MKTTVSGGIMPDFETEEFRRWLNEGNEEEERRRKEAVEAAEREAELGALYDRIEAEFTPYLHKEAAAVNSASRIKPADKTIFEQFRKYCARWSPPLSPLPAHPAAV